MDWAQFFQHSGDFIFRVGPWIFGGILGWWALIKFLEKPPWGKKD